jgi:hypothetical protein
MTIHIYTGRFREKRICFERRCIFAVVLVASRDKLPSPPFLPMQMGTTAVPPLPLRHSCLCRWEQLPYPLSLSVIPACADGNNCCTPSPSPPFLPMQMGTTSVPPLPLRHSCLCRWEQLLYLLPLSVISACADGNNCRTSSPSPSFLPVQMGTTAAPPLPLRHSCLC